MFRKTLRKIIPTYAIFPLALTGILNLLAYQGAKLVQFLFGTANALDLTTAWDRAIPFRPAWVLVYVGTFLFWIYQYTTVARESPEKVCQLAAADLTAKLICLVFFVAMPTTNTRTAVEGSGFIPCAMRLIYALDTPTNLFPSIHCFVAWLGTRYIFECRHLRRRVLTSALCCAGTLLVFASTLFTKQHVLWDVAGGMAVAEIGWLVARYTKLPKAVRAVSERFQKTKLCSYL